MLPHTNIFRIHKTEYILKFRKVVLIHKYIWGAIVTNVCSILYLLKFNVRFYHNFSDKIQTQWLFCPVQYLAVYVQLYLFAVSCSPYLKYFFNIVN